MLLLSIEFEAVVYVVLGPGCPLEPTLAITEVRPLVGAERPRRQVDDGERVRLSSRDGRPAGPAADPTARRGDVPVVHVDLDDLALARARRLLEVRLGVVDEQVAPGALGVAVDLAHRDSGRAAGG